MNRQRYRLVFSQNVGGLVPAAENTRGRGKAASGFKYGDLHDATGSIPEIALENRAEQAVVAGHDLIAGMAGGVALQGDGGD